MRKTISSISLYLAGILWGVAFAWSMLFASDKILVFYQDFFNRGHFFYAVIVLLWLFFAFERFFSFSIFSGIRGIIAALLNLLWFGWMVYPQGELPYLYAYPLIFSIQVFLLYILLGSNISSLRYAKVFMFAGVLLALYGYPFFPVFWVALLIGFFSSLFTLMALWLNTSYFSEEYQESDGTPMFHYSLLLYILKFLRYFFLAAVFFDALENLENFRYSAAILVVGFLLKKIFSRKKIQLVGKHFALSLAYLFVIAFLVAFAFPPFIWNAFLYVLLSLWTTLLFPKTKKRGEEDIDLLLSGEVIFIFLLLQSFSVPWFETIILLLVALPQIYFSFYFLRLFRYTAASVFFISFLAWSALTFTHYKTSASVAFIRPLKNYVYSSFMLSRLWELPSHKIIETNAFANSLNLPPQKVKQHNWHSLFLPFYLRYKAKKEEVYFIDLQRLSAYKKKNNLEMLLERVSYNKQLDGLLFFYNYENSFAYRVQNGKWKLVPNEPSIPNPNEQQKKFFYQVAMSMGDYFTQQSLFNDALFVYQQLLPWFKQDEQLYLRLSKTCGSMGAIDLQIYYLKQFLSLHKNFSISFEQQLMELLFFKGDYKESKTQAEKLIVYDQKHRLDYLQWIFRIATKSDNKNEWRKVYHRVLKHRTEKNSSEERKKIALLDTIEKFLAQHPDAASVMKIERIRQEKMEIPEN